MYVGTAAGFGVLHPVFAQGFMQGVGSASMFASATQDCANKFAVAHQVYGFPFTQPFPDLDNLECLIIVGANPAISKWAFLQVSNPIRRLKEVEARGAKIFIVDPRRTETAKVAGEHVFIRPNTDVFFYLSFLHELLATADLDMDRINTYMTGFAEMRRVAEAWPPERTAEVTQIPPETLRRPGQSLPRSQRRGALLLDRREHGHQRLHRVLAAGVHQRDFRQPRPQGRHPGEHRESSTSPRSARRRASCSQQNESRIGKFKSVNDALPGGIMADEILTPGDRQIKALFVTGGNPLITMANSERLRDAFKELELLVVLDIQPSETASVATHVLPCTSPFQRPDLPFVFPLMLGLQSKPYLQATKAIIPPQGEQRDEASIYVDIAKGERRQSLGLRRRAEVDGSRHGPELDRQGRQASARFPQELFLSGILRATKQGSFKKLLKEKHGRLRPTHEPESFLGERIIHDDGMMHLAPDVLMKQTEKLEADFEKERQSKDKLKLITKRAITTHNSWTHNIDEFVNRERRTNHLYMHPDDAARVGVEEGQLVDVQSETGQVRLPVRDSLRPDARLRRPAPRLGPPGTKMGVASKTTGVNVNLLAADGPDKIERVSGMAHLTGIPVDVRPAAGRAEPGPLVGHRPRRRRCAIASRGSERRPERQVRIPDRRRELERAGFRRARPSVPGRRCLRSSRESICCASRAWVTLIHSKETRIRRPGFDHS